MSDGRMKNSARNLMSGIINKIVAMLFPFIIRTVIIKEIGIEYAGLNGLFSSVLAVLSISELGFGSAMVYSMYKPVAEKDDKKVCALLNLYRTVYRYVGLIILVFGLILIPFLNHLIKGDVPSDINLYILYLVFLFNTVISYFAFAYKSSILTATQREDLNTKVNTYVNIALYIAQLGVLIAFKHFMTYIVLLPVFTIITNIVRSYVVDKTFPQYKCEGKIEKEELKSIYKNVGALVGNRINGTIILSADNIVISAIIGLEANACYNNYYYIINSLVGFFAIFFNAIRPSIGNSMVTENIEKNYDDFKKVSSMVSWLAGFCSISLVCLFQPFMVLWVGKKYLLPMATVIMFGIYFYEWKMLDVLVLYRDAGGMWWSDRYRPYIVSVVNIVGNITLVYLFGVNGVVFATLFSSMCISYPWVLKILFKEYFKKNSFEYFKTILYNTIIIGIAGVSTFFTCKIIDDDGIFHFMLKGFTCLIIPNLIIYFTFGKNTAVISILKRKIIHKAV